MKTETTTYYQWNICHTTNELSKCVNMIIAYRYLTNAHYRKHKCALNTFPLPQINCIHVMYSEVYRILRMLCFSLS